MHRDLKPANCLVQDDGAGLLVQAKLADLGCSKKIVEGDSNPNNPQTFVGTDGYRAPEVTGQQYNKSADYWSVGATIICCAIGNPRGLLPSGTGVGDGPGVPQFLNMYPEATIVAKLVSINPKERPTADIILKDGWVNDTRSTDVPNEDAVSDTEIQEAQGKLASDLASVQAEKEDALQQKEEAEDEIARLKAALAALQAKAGSTKEKLAEPNAPEGEVKRRSTRSACRVQHDDSGDDDDIEKAPKSKKRGKQKKTNAPRRSISAAHPNKEKLDAFILQQGYGSNQTLVADLYTLHSKVAAINASVAKHGDKFLEPYIDSTDQGHKIQLFRDLCDKGGGSETWKMTEGPFLAAAVHRVRHAILENRDYSKISQIASDLCLILLGQADYHEARLQDALETADDDRKILANCPIRRDMTCFDAINQAAATGSDGGLDDAEPAASSPARTRLDAMLKAGEEFVEDLCGLAPTEQNLQMDEILAPKCSAYLLANIVTLKVVVAGMNAITLGELNDDIKTKVMNLARSQNSPVADTTTISNVCSSILAPALKDDAHREGDNGAIQTFADIIVSAKSRDFLDVFRNAAAESIIETDASSEDDAEDADGEENASGNTANLSEGKLEEYLTIFSAVFLSDCIKMRFEELVGINDDVIELVMRCSMSVMRVNLVPMIMKGKRKKKSFIFQDGIDDSGISAVCGYVAVMFENAVKSNLADKNASNKRWKCIEFWNKKIMLQAVPGNAQLLLRALTNK